MANLPEDLIAEILSWVPPESLLIFKCVCKPWYVLINDSKFIAKHCLNSLRHPDNKGLIFLNRLVPKGSDENDNILSFLTYPTNDIVNIDIPFSSALNIHGYNRGIICLSDWLNHIYLFNPAIREFRRLPPSILLTELREGLYEYVPKVSGVGFGYDPKCEDFKVVRIVNFVNGNTIFYHPTRVEVYNLNTDEWREIKRSAAIDHIFCAPNSGVYYNGVYYWWHHYNCEAIIISFDMSEEKFCQIPMPTSFGETCHYYKSMLVWNGRIVQFHYPIWNEKRFDIWAKDGSSWSKLLTIGPVSGIEKILLFVNEDEVIMQTKIGQLTAYNMNTGEFKNIPVKRNPAGFQGFVFSKTLVSVKGGSRAEIK